MADAVAPLTLEQVFASTQHVAALRMFAAAEFAEENVFFVQDVNEMKEAKAPRYIPEIVKEYIRPSAPMEINITHPTRQAILDTYRDAMTSQDFGVFDRAVEEVMQLIETNLLPRFNASLAERSAQAKATADLRADKKRVVIVGGGFTSAVSAIVLDAMPRFHVTLIDQKEYFEFTPAMVRALVDLETGERNRVLHRQYLKNGRLLLATVTEVAKDHVIADGARVDFDYLIIGSGSSYTTSLLKGRNVSTSYRSKRLRAEFTGIQDAKTVLIIGGGVVGCEIAGEVATAYPDKQITIVDAHENLVRRLPTKAQRLAKRYLERLGVKIIFGQRVIYQSESDALCFVTDKGVALTADKVLVATGPRPVSFFMKQHLSDTLADDGHIRVERSCQVVGYPHIFAGGDVNDLPVEKLANTAAQQGVLIARNICRIEKGRPVIALGTKGTQPVARLPAFQIIAIGNNTSIVVHNGRRAFASKTAYSMKERISATSVDMVRTADLRKAAKTLRFGRLPSKLSQKTSRKGRAKKARKTKAVA